MAKKAKPPESRYGDMVELLAERVGTDPASALNQLLYYRHDVQIELRGGQRYPVTHLPGHLVGPATPTPQPLPRGPQKARVMVITSHPNQLESRVQLYLAGAHGQEFRQACYAAGVDPHDWYVTGLCKFEYPQGRTSPLSGWVKEESAVLLREIELVEPEFILAMGAQVFSWLFPKKKLTNCLGSIQTWNGVTVFPCLSPHNVTAQPETQAEFYRAIGSFVNVLKGGKSSKPFDVRVKVLNTPEKIKEFVAENMDKKVWSVDCEWGGNDPHTGGLRTIQLASKVGECGVVHLRSAGWPMPAVQDEKAAIEALRPLLERDDVRCIGHFWRSDLLWLDHLGLKLLPQFLRGLDTILTHHVLYPTDDQQLELIANKLLGCERYDAELRDWTGENKKSVDQYAYAEVPDEILIPYAAHDAEKTLIIAGKLMQQLNLPENEPMRRVLFHVANPANAGIFEMETQGLRVDMDRFSYLEARFQEKGRELMEQVRVKVGWPDFNPNSPEQKVDLLFGSRYHGKKDKDGKPIQLRPATVPCLGLVPVKTTGKKPIMWDVIQGTEQETFYSPSTDDETMGILAAEAPVLSTLRDFAYIEKANSMFFPEPEQVGKGKNKKLTYTGGIRAWRQVDGCVHTHISQLAETARWRSFDPNMQNLPSQRESDFKRIFGDESWPSLKSMFVGDEDMPVILESDLKTAEVVGLAHLSGDPRMLEVMMDPKRDIHSEMGIKMFKLPYDPQCGISTKKWINGQYSDDAGRVEKIEEFSPQHRVIWLDPGHGKQGKKIEVWPGLELVVKEGQEILKGSPLVRSLKQFRVGAKTIVFGIPYQRGAKAVAREIGQFGIECTVKQAQGYIDDYYEEFPDAGRFLQFCKESVYNPGFLESVYGRRRWFFTVQNEGSMAAQQREACNWPVQNIVADYVSRAVWLFYQAHQWSRAPFRLKLAVHDSVVLCCRGEDVPYICENVIPRCLAYDNVVPLLNFHFGVEMETNVRLATKASAEELEAAGVPKGYKPPDIEAAFCGEAKNPYREKMRVARAA